MSAIYNEIDRGAAEWMRNLIAGGHIADGVVDERSIADLAPADVSGHGHRHFFAGIGGWAYALRLAGVVDTADVWTGSCPCQPFSAAGRGLGTADERHLWPEWFRLIRECRPAVVLGEQVASKAGLGWLDAVFADLEGAGYACGAADLPAAGVGAPHIRQRLYFVAYADGEHGRLHAQERQPGRAHAEAERRGEAGALANAEASGRGTRRIDRAHGWSTLKLDRHGTNSWSGCDWIPCSDGKSRPVEPGTHPLVDELPNRVGLLRGYGNAIVPAQAAAFVSAALEARP